MNSIRQTVSSLALPWPVKHDMREAQAAPSQAGQFSDLVTLGGSRAPAGDNDIQICKSTGTHTPLFSSRLLSGIASVMAAATLFMAIAAPASHAYADTFYKGNLHCHTTMSDGNTSPRNVAQWYKDHGYSFVIITDHNVRTKVEGQQDDGFLIIPGEEVSDVHEGKPIHLNGFNLSHTVAPRGGDSVQQTLQNDIDAILDAGGMVQLNHPNWKWSYNENHIRTLSGAGLLEVHNDTVECNNFAAGGSRGTEGIWDSLLSQGRVIYGTAADDAHTFEGSYEPGHHWPGGAWVMVKAPDLTTQNILSSLRQGNFYATTGVTLSEVKATDRDYSVTIEQRADLNYTTTFIGQDGRTLKQVDGTEARYEYRGDEYYVRAKIISTDGRYALTQPCFIAPHGTAQSNSTTAQSAR